MEKRDIQTREDIVELVDAFYVSVRLDALIGPIFNDVANVNWETHLPRMYAFWETVLMSTAGYKGNPVYKHVQLSAKTKLSEEHFDRWIALFEQTVDTHFCGERAEIAKERARMMSNIMLYKCNQARTGYGLHVIRP